jgi:hypothetical protein
VHSLVDQGVIEITLLGQNVNAYGVDFGDRSAFANLLKECGKVDGLERVRFMSPHPRDFTDVTKSYNLCEGLIDGIVILELLIESEKLCQMQRSLPTLLWDFRGRVMRILHKLLIW